MKSLKVIPLLDSIPKISSYSNYGTNLEKIFKMKSLRYLIKTLKFKKDYLKQLINESTVVKYNDEYDVFDKQKKDKAKEEETEVDIFSLPLSKSEEKLKIKKNNVKNYFFPKKIMREFDTNSLAYKYYPNFHSIDKNVPSVKIIQPSPTNKINKKFDLFNQEIKKNLNHNYNTKLINKENKEKKKDKNIILNSIAYLNTIDNYKNLKYQFGLKNKPINFRNINQNASCKINTKTIKSLDTAHRFKTEMPLKTPKKSKSKINSTEKLPCLSSQKDEEKNNNNNTTSFHFKNRAIDFTKMSSRKARILKKNTPQMPDICSYDPKYNLVEKRQYDIFFNKRPENDKYRKKKILLNKILTSYEVESNYQTIDNNKLNNDILLKYRFLK